MCPTQQTWRAARQKTLVIHDLKNLSKLPKEKFAKRCCKNVLILQTAHFLKPGVQGGCKEEEETMLLEVIWSLGAGGIMMKTYFKVEAKSAQYQNFRLKKDGVSDDRVNIRPRES